MHVNVGQSIDCEPAELIKRPMSARVQLIMKWWWRRRCCFRAASSKVLLLAECGIRQWLNYKDGHSTDTKISIKREKCTIIAVLNKKLCAGLAVSAHRRSATIGENVDFI